MKRKKVFIIDTITIFLCMFLFHFVYNLFPNFLTAAFFPVNESLFEHLKLIFISEIIVGLVTFFILKNKKISINNYFFGLFLATIFNLFLFFLIYLPIYNRFGEGIVYTMLIFLVTLIISEYLFYLITLQKEKEILNALSINLIPLFWLILVYLTFNPLHTDFFFDPKAEIYGIPKKVD